MSSNYFTGLMVVFIVMLTLTAVGLADTPVQYEIDFTANTTSGFVPLEVLFTDTSTVPGEVISRYWDFGDGTDVPGPELSVIHIYTSPGLYSVRMDRTDDEGVHSRVKFDYITAEESPPPTPTTPPTTIPTTGPTTQPTTTPTTGPTTGPTTSPTTSPTTIPTTGPTTQPTTSPTTVPTTGTSHPPAEFRGTVTVSGSPAQPGSIITGTIGGIERGRITTSVSGIYGGSGPFDERLRIYATDEDLSGGNPVIRFTVNGYDADQAVLFVEGSSTRLDLTAAGPVTPTTQPTTSPTTAPTTGPTTQPTTSPTTAPTTTPTTGPTTSPTTSPTTIPTTGPTTSPTTSPTTIPTTGPTTSPTTSPTTIPTTGPTTQPTTSPTTIPTTGTSHPPAEFRGAVTVSGSPAQPGSIITGTIGGIERGRITTSISGIYGGSGPFDERLRIYATDEDLSGGNPVIRFTVNGYDADQAVLFVEGSSTRLDLTAAGPVTPTTSPTTAPTTGPTTQPTTSPTTAPTTGPTTQPTTSPTTAPTTGPTTQPTTSPTTAPTTGPTTQPTTSPTTAPTTVPTTQPTPPGPADLYISLWPGWNFVSVPMVLEEGFNTAGIFHDVDTRGHGIFSYNASSMRWLQMNRTTLLTPAGSLWIYSANSMQVPLHFSKNQTKQDITLMKGWNGLGITGNSSSQAKNAFSPLGDNWSYAMGFNSISQQYEISIINGGSGSHSDTRQVYPTHGYWILMAENMTFKPFP